MVGTQWRVKSRARALLNYTCASVIQRFVLEPSTSELGSWVIGKLEANRQAKRLTLSNISESLHFLINNILKVQQILLQKVAEILFMVGHLRNLLDVRLAETNIIALFFQVFAKVDFYVAA